MLQYITSNQDKINVAIRNLNPLGVSFEAKSIELIEIQSSSLEDIAKDKAKQAFKAIKKPLFVSDHGWEIPALNGFPGPYMKYMNDWLTSQDFLNLMNGHSDKTIIKREVICFVDASHSKCFTSKIEGRFINGIRGEGLPAMRVVSFLPSGKSVAECTEDGVDSYENNPIWKNFANWIKSNTYF